MSARVTVRPGILPGGPDLVQFPAPAGLSFGELREFAVPEDWGGTPVVILLDGRPVLRDTELVPPSGEVLVVPALGNGVEIAGINLGELFGFGKDRVGGSAANEIADEGGLDVNSLFGAAAAIGVIGHFAGWWGAETAQLAGDNESPTYGWEGIQTTVGSGHMIPTVWGEIDVGGQIIYAQVLVDSASQVEYLAAIVAIGAGRIHAIGDITGGSAGETNQLGQVKALGFDKSTGNLPANFKVNGASIDPAQPDGILMYLRHGELTQRPLPDSSPFQGTSTLQNVGGSLNDTGNEVRFTIPDAAPFSRFEVILAWPQGCYWQRTNTDKWTQKITIGWRRPGQTTWSGRSGIDVTPPPRRGYTSMRVSQGFRNTTEGPLEIRVVRESPAGGPDVQSQCEWRQISWRLVTALAYPGVSYAAVLLAAGEKVSGASPNLRFRTKARLVRVWSEENGFSEYLWEAPTAAPWLHSGQPIWKNPPGRNPAWLCLEYLLAEDGLGRWLTEDDIDLQAFRNWADWCDGDLTGAPAGTPRFQCDMVHDTPAASWDRVQLFGRAGRGRIMELGRRRTVVYDYVEAHGRGSNVVPSRSATMLVADSNVEEFSMSYLARTESPTVIQFQFLDREREFKRSDLTVETPIDVGLNAPYKLGSEGYKLQTFTRFDVTDRSQLERDGRMIHRVNRQVIYGCEFVAGLDMLVATVGDVIKVQSHVVRPFASEAVGWRIPEQIAAAASYIVLDHALTIEPATTYDLWVVNSLGVLEGNTITQAAGSYIAGTQLTCSGSWANDINEGAVVVVGQRDEVVLEFEIREITLAGAMKRRVACRQWVPEAFADEYLDGDAEDFIDDVTMPTFPESIEAFDALEASQLERLTLERDTKADLYRLSWARGSDRVGGYVRAYYRPTGRDAWWPVGETRHDSIELTELSAGESYEFAVAVQDQATGAFQQVHTATQATIEAPEFPAASPPAVTALRATAKDDGILLEWDPVDSEIADGYEVRLGSSWLGAEKVYYGRQACFLHRGAPRTTQNYQVRARADSGLYSPVGAKVASLSWLPQFLTLGGESEELSAGESVGGTTDRLTWDSVSGDLQLAASNAVGVYTSSEVDATTVARRWWYVFADLRQEDAYTVDDMTWPIGGGEARWRTVDGREPSPAQPGVDLATTVDDLTMPIDQMTEGSQVGQHVHGKIEVRYHNGTSWGAWEPHLNEWRSAQKIQARLTMRREDLGRQVYASNMVIGYADATP